jgi:hypothetical protein
VRGLPATASRAPRHRDAPASTDDACDPHPPGYLAGMADDEARHTDDPRRTGRSDQNAEEGPQETVHDHDDPDPDDAAGRAPATSHPSEGDPGQATGNPDAAGNDRT